MEKNTPEILLAVGGLGLALFGVAIPWVWKNMPTAISYPMIFVGIALMIWSLAHGLRWHSSLSKIFKDKGTHHANALSIIFDSSNPSRKFWSVESQKDEAGKHHPYWEYRAIVRNSSNKTIRNVKVTVECTGPMPTRPEQSLFDMNKKPLIDLNPNEEALVVIRTWYCPHIVAGMAFGEDTYGPIKLTASADDVSAAVKLFHFDPENTPMVYE